MHTLLGAARHDAVYGVLEALFANAGLLLLLQPILLEAALGLESASEPRWLL